MSSLALRTVFTSVVLVLAFASAAAAATPSVSVGKDFACAVSSAGDVYCWGRNDVRQLGNGGLFDSAAPVKVPGVANASAVSAGESSACALLADATVKCWGSNLFGARGTDAGTVPNGMAVTIVGLTGVSSLSAGAEFFCAVVSGGSVKCWGQGTRGQLGNADTLSTGIPQTVIGLGAPVTSVSAGNLHACATTSAGAAKCWGDNTELQIQNSGVDLFSTAQTAGLLTSGVASTSAGRFHNCVTTTIGGVKCWGIGENGVQGNGTTAGTASPQTTSISSGAAEVTEGDRSVCARVSGQVLCWGANSNGEVGDGTTLQRNTPTPVLGLGADVTDIDSGGSNSCAIKQNAVVCWGAKAFGALGDGTTALRAPTDLPGVSGLALSGGFSDSHACFSIGGDFKCWGDNAFYKLGAASPTFSSVPVTADLFSSSASALAVGDQATCRLTPSHAIACIGSGALGQLGNGATTDSGTTPVTPTDLGTGAQKIFGNGKTFCAVTSSLSCWGSNFNALLGRGDDHEYPYPVYSSTPAGSSNAGSFVPVAVAISETHACAVESYMYCWGLNAGGSVAGGGAETEMPDYRYPLVGTGVSGADAVAVGTTSTCFIASTPADSVYCFGTGNKGELGDGAGGAVANDPVSVSGFTNPTSIAGGASSYCAVNSGLVKCWGSNDRQQLGRSDILSATTPVTVPGLTGIFRVFGDGKRFCAGRVSGALTCWGDGTQGQLALGVPLGASAPVTVVGLTLVPPVQPGPGPGAGTHAAQKVSPKLKVNGKIKKSGKKQISVPLKLYFAAPAGSNAATVCSGNTTISIKTSKKKTAKLKVRFTRKGANCTFAGKIKLPKSFKGKKKKFTISVPTNADVLAYKGTKTLKLK